MLPKPRGIVGLQVLSRLTACVVLAACSVSCEGHVIGKGDAEALQGPSTPSPPGVNGPFSCAEPDAPEITPLRRLTRYEYSSAVRALLSTDEGSGGASVLRPALDMAPIEALLSALPEDRPLDGHSLFDTSHLRTDESHVLSHFQVAEQVAEVMATDPIAYQKLVGENCVVATSDPSPCLRALLVSFGTRVLRRPVSAEEHALYLERYKAAASAADHAAGIKSVIATLLNAPSFIFHLEDQGTPVGGAPPRLELTPHERAARLSFALTGTVPDAELRAKAHSGELGLEASFELEVDRLLELPSAKAHIKRFFSQWLRIPETGDLTALSPDFLGDLNAVGLVPKISAEVHDFIQDIVWQERGGLQELLLSRRAFISDPALARIYGVSAAASSNPLVELGPTHAGLLTRAALLLGSSESTSPIARGVRLRRHILCDELAEPGNIEVSDAELAPIPDETLYSTRQIFEHRTSLSRCQACHVAINGLGFAFESYDTLGRFRTEEYKYDAKGTRIATVPVDVRAAPRIDAESLEVSQDAVQLSRMLADSQKAHRCLTAQWIEYSVGSRPNESGASCFRARAYEALTTEQGGIAAMLRQTAREIYAAQKAL